MYNPYGNSLDENLYHPQPQHPQGYLIQNFQGQSRAQQRFLYLYPQAPGGAQGGLALFQGQYPPGQTTQFLTLNTGQSPVQTALNDATFPNFLNDPAAALASQFAKEGFNSSNQYIQQNFGQFINGTGTELRYYFQVTNSYVLNKILIILFPYKNKNWVRLTTADIHAEQAALLQFAPPNYDVNAPDLYIPIMSFITYILLWALFQGFKGDFHPQVFGYLASQTFACSLFDIAIFKIGLYLLNCSTQSSIWDLISFSGYKYVSIIVLLFWKHLIGNGWFTYYPVVFILMANLAVFLMRSLKFLVLPNTIEGSATTTVTAKQRRIRVQFLFLYSVVVQGVIILFMSW